MTAGDLGDKTSNVRDVSKRREEVESRAAATREDKRKDKDTEVAGERQ
jgi:hypothetical protein